MYFTKEGKINTQRTIELALKRGRELGIKDYVFASSTGYTGELMAKNKDLNLVCVTYQCGFERLGRLSMRESVRRRLEDKGVKVLVATHLFRGLDKAFKGSYPPEIVGNTLRLFSEGVKVGVEISVMALDAGLIPYAQDVIAIGGTGRGADSALVIRPTHSYNFFETRIKEIICKPY